MGVELGTTSVSSPSPSSYLGDSAFDYSLLLRKENKSVRFHDPLQKGYIILSLTEDKGEVEYVGLSTITSLSYEAMVAAKFDLKKSGGTVKLTNPKGLGLKERILF